MLPFGITNDSNDEDNSVLYIQCTEKAKNKSFVQKSKFRIMKFVFAITI